MEEDCRSWLPHWHSDWQPPNLNCSSTQSHSGQQNKYMNLCTNVAAKYGNFPICALPEMSQLRATQENEPHGWFYCLPRSRQAFVPTEISVFKDRIINGPNKDHKEKTVTPNVGSGHDQKRFLVFDQTGDQTKLIFSSGNGAAPLHCPTSWTPKPLSAYKWSRGEQREEKRNPNLDHSGPILTDEFNDNHETDAQSEMHEDTEELNALLYSEDDSDSTEYDEVSSTGHSPSAMTTHDDKQFWLEGIVEEVGSSDGPTKRQKLPYGVYNIPSIVDTASSMKHRSSDYEGDAESSCAVGKNHCLEETGCLSGKKRTRKEKIRETVSVLQSIIPGGKGKNAIMVLEEAINYLKSLKLKAKSLGVDSL